MARYRTYKNGITGHKYRGLYIIKGEEKIIRENRKEIERETKPEQKMEEEQQESRKISEEEIPKEKKVSY